ncbi:predicted protein [Enterococcus faecium 1,231,501]|nr:predicted protein [Enterococcus faecium 1,231,501]
MFWQKEGGKNENFISNGFRISRSTTKVIKSNIDLGAYNHIVGAAVWCMNGNMYDESVYSNHETCIEIIALGIAISHGERDF